MLSSVLDNAPTYLTFLETAIGRLDQHLIAVATEVLQDNSRDVSIAARLLALQPQRYRDQEALQQDVQTITDAISLGLRKYHGDKVQSGTLTHDEIAVGFLLGNERLHWYLVAISLGAVFFGAMTYIGNGPNFMVKSLAENAGVKCPSFFGYIFVYSLPLLLPILLLVWWLFLRPYSGV